MSNLINSIHSQIRAYDQAIKNWLETFPAKDDGTVVPVVVSTPDRAFASMRNLMVSKGHPENMPVRNIPLPFISLYRTGASFDASRNMGASGHVPYNYAAKTGKILQARHPIAYLFDYRVEMWAKNQQTLNNLQEYIAFSFSTGFQHTISADLSQLGYYEDFQVPLVNNGIIFSGVEEPEQGHRVMRQVLNVNLRAWVFGPQSEVGTVGQIVIEYCNNTVGEVLLDTQLIEPGDEEE